MSRTEEFTGATFRASREGLATVLGELEAEIMEFLWSDAEDPLPARAVTRTVGVRRGVKHITIVTVLNNLCKKGLLHREKHGRAYYYEPTVSRDAFLRRVSHDVLSGMIRLAPDMAVTSFVDVLAELRPEAIERLNKRLAERRRQDG